MGKRRDSKRKTDAAPTAGLPASAVVISHDDPLLQETSNEVSGPTGPQMGIGNVTIPPAVTQLQSEVAREREWACVAISNFVNEPEPLRILLSHHVVELLINRLGDTEPSVAVAAAGAVRNLCSAGGLVVCQQVVKLGVLNIASTRLTTVANSIEAPESDERTVAISLIEQYFAILWTLCENIEQVVDFVSSSAGIFTTVYAILQHFHRLPRSLQWVTVELLATITEDNANLSQTLSLQKPFCLALINLTTLQPSLDHDIVVIAANVLYNLSEAIQKAVGVNVLDSVISILFVAVAKNGIDNLAAIVPNLPKLLAKNTDEEPLDSSDQSAISQLSRLFDSQQRALELLSNMAATASDADAAEEEWEDTEGDVMEMEDSKPMQSTDTLTEAGLAIINAGLPRTVLARCEHVPTHITDLLAQENQYVAKEGLGQLLRRYDVVQCRAIACLKNLIGLSSSAQIFGLFSWNELWSGLFALAARNSAKSAWCSANDLADLYEAETGAMFALWRRLEELHVTPDQYPIVEPAQLELLVNAGYHATTEVQVNAIGTVGLIEKANHTNESLSLQLCECLLSVLEKSASVVVIAGSLDVLFDIFGEVDKNSVFASLNALNRMNACLGRLNTVLPQLKSELSRDVYSHVAEARSNLKRFIDYKKQPGH